MTTNMRTSLHNALTSVGKSLTGNAALRKRRSNRRRRQKNSFGGQRLESLERRDLFAGDLISAPVEMTPGPEPTTVAVAAEVDSDAARSVNMARTPRSPLQIDAAKSVKMNHRLVETVRVGDAVRDDANYAENVDAVFAAAPLGESHRDGDAEQVHLPQEFEQLRAELGDEGFAEWLLQNAHQSGNFQNVGEQQIENWHDTNPERLVEFEQVEQALHEWLQHWDATACGEENVDCDSNTGDDSPSVGVLPEHFEAMRQEIGDEGLVHVLVDNVIVSGNSLGQDFQHIEMLRETDPNAYAEFLDSKGAVDTWLNDTLDDVDATLPAELPDEFDAMRYEMGEEELAEMLRQNVLTYGVFQAQSAQGLGAEATEAFVVREQQLFGFVMNVLLSPNPLPVNAGKQVKETSTTQDGNGTTTTTTTYTDGSKTIIEEKGGKTIRTEQNKDGSKTVHETDANGDRTETDYNKKGQKTEKRTFKPGEEKPSVREKYKGNGSTSSRTTYWPGTNTPKETTEYRNGCEVKTQYNQRGKPVVEEHWDTTGENRKLKKRIVSVYDANHRLTNRKVFTCIEGVLTLVKETRIEYDVDINFGGEKGTVGKKTTEFERDGAAMRKKREVAHSNDGKKHSVTKFDKDGIGRGHDLNTDTVGTPKPRKFTTDKQGKRYYLAD